MSVYGSMYIKDLVPEGWKNELQEEFLKEYFSKLEAFVQLERKQKTIFPPEKETFTALELTSYQDVRVIILGQDPYHGDGQAHGLSFSVCNDQKLPPSLKNIFKELHSDIGDPLRTDGNLADWAEQGVLLLNTVLSVREGEANSHKSKGWELFTDAILERLDEKEEPLVFLLWGNQAKKKKSIISNPKHCLIESAHPSPLSARHGFLGSKCFSRVNEFLIKHGSNPINWS